MTLRARRHRLVQRAKRDPQKFSVLVPRVCCRVTNVRRPKWMEKLNLLLALAGLFLGLVSAWSPIKQFASRLLGASRARAQKAAALRSWRLHHAATAPTYLIAVLVQRFGVAAFLFYVSHVMRVALASDSTLTNETIFALEIVRSATNLASGWFFGGLFAYAKLVAAAYEGTNSAPPA